METAGTTATNPDPNGRDAVVARLTRLDNHIRFEFELIAQRMTWLVIFQSFLFPGFLIAVNAIHPPPAAPGQAPLKHPLEQVVGVLPALGMTSAIVVLLAVVAAHSAARRLKWERVNMEQLATSHGLYMNAVVGPRRWQHYVGNLPPLVVPAALIAAWVYLLSVVKI